MLNLHTRLFTYLVKHQFDSFQKRAPVLADLASIVPPRGIDVRRDPTLDLDVGDDDFEEAGLTPTGRVFVEIFNRCLRASDSHRGYGSIDEAARDVRDTFGDRLPIEVQWSDPTSDAALVRLVTQGIGAHALARGSDPRTWQVDFSFMLDYRVRPGFLRYGAKLVLEEGVHGALTPRSITWARGTHEQGDAEWEEAKLAFRAALAIGVTIRDHAVGCHFLPANSMVIAVRKHLPDDHALRSFLRAFQFRTPAINAGALVTLVPPHAIFSRLFALEWPDLARFYQHSKDAFRWRPLPATLAAAGLDTLGERHPYAHDALELWRHEHRLVSDYLECVGVDDEPRRDPAIARMHDALVRTLPATADVPPIHTRAQLVDLVTQSLFVGTGWHEQVGGALGDYLSRPDFIPPALRDGRSFPEMLPSRQTMIQGAMLAVLTNFTMPRLTDNFAPLVPAPGRPAVYRWITGLGELRDTIDARNAAREQALPTFHPDHVEISVSI